MTYLNDKIIAYLTVNNIPFTAGDYQTGQPEGQPDQVLTWDAAKLGPQPTQAQLDAAFTAHEAKLAAEEQAKETAKQAAMAKLAALGLTADDLKSLLV